MEALIRTKKNSRKNEILKKKLKLFRGILKSSKKSAGTVKKLITKEKVRILSSLWDISEREMYKDYITLKREKLKIKANFDEVQLSKDISSCIKNFKLYFVVFLDYRARLYLQGWPISPTSRPQRHFLEFSEGLIPPIIESSRWFLDLQKKIK